MTVSTTYDDLGRKVWVKDPNQGRTDFVYNDFGELESETDANGHAIDYDHDQLGRVIARRGDNQEAATFTWDSTKPGLIASESSGGSNGIRKIYTYDSAARPTTVATTIEGTTYNVTTQYDGNYGRPKSMTYPNNLTVKLAYNPKTRE